MTRSMDAETLGYALLFSVPTGAGVALAVLETTAGTYATTAVLGGLLAAVFVFGIVALGRTDGGEDHATGEGR